MKIPRTQRALLLALLLSAPAYPGNDIVMSSGLEGGGYWGAATRLQGVARELGLGVEVLESRGSVHNLQQLDDPASPVNLTLSQSDALQYYIGAHPGLGQQIEILEHIGQECVFFVAGRDSGIENLADLQSSARRIALAL